MRYLCPMEDANILVYTMRDLNQATGRVMQEIRDAGKPAYITSYGRYIAVITPLEPGQVEQQALAAIARQIAGDARTANREIAGGLKSCTETTETGEQR